MPEVQNIGAVDYNQYQPAQNQNDIYMEDYSAQPEVYDERMAEMQAANKSRLGATALGLLIVGGLALWGGHAWGKHSAGKAVDVADKYKEFQNKAAELEKEADKVIDSNFGGLQYGKDFAKKVKATLKEFFSKAEEGKDAAKDGANAADNAAK